jgi:hypothetical protein
MTFWHPTPSGQALLAGWTLQEIERTPVLPAQNFTDELATTCEVRIRRSDEDPRAIWQMVFGENLKLSYGAVVSVVPKSRS